MHAIPKPFYNEIAHHFIESKIKSKQDLQNLKIKLAEKYKLTIIPSNSMILKNLPLELKERYIEILRVKSTRTLSGVAVIAIMTSPEKCPHGRCLYCPGGLDSNTPQSYTGHEPAALRAKQHNYDPYEQVMTRLRQYKETGHKTDKIDLIIMGGTFTRRTRDYQINFVKRAYEALNAPSTLYSASCTLEDIQRVNETAENRVVGLTIETRPDCFNDDDARFALSLGTTRVELGVQTPDDEVLSKLSRGHGVNEIIEATKRIKDFGFKLCYHIMPGLPFMTLDKDIANFRKLFESSDFRPDMLKIYPCLVTEDTEIYKWWKNGDYIPYDTEHAVEVIAKMKTYIPSWVRIQRIQRDIPAKLIVAGVKVGNLRELIHEKMRMQNIRCRCIRCREIGRVRNTKYEIRDTKYEIRDTKYEIRDTKYEIRDTKYGENLDLRITKYDASGGVEYFISYENPELDAIYGYARLRHTSDENFIIRELKVVGRVAPLRAERGHESEINERSPFTIQHQGIGKNLVAECEKIAIENSAKKIFVVSGVGVRNYYRRLGYELKNNYMVKTIW